MKEKKPTIKTIARLAGVSHVAVSRALRGHSDISKETTERILRIAGEVGYTPNAFARNLSQRLPGGIGMIVPSIAENTAYSRVFTVISGIAARHGYCVMLGCSGRDVELEAQYCRMMCENRAGALIVASATSEVAHFHDICRSHTPLIFIGGKTAPQEPYSLRFDYRHGAGLVVEHLAGLGHSDIALFTYQPENLTILQKEEGFTRAMQARGLAPRLYRHGHSGDTRAAGRQLVQRLAQQGALPTALWCASDLMAVGALEGLAEAGLKVPQDVSVVGHDDLFTSSFAAIDLTTLAMDHEAIGRHAVTLALGLMGEVQEAAEPRAEFRPRLVIRGSTGPPPGRR